MRSWGLTILRVAVGIVFLAHGWQKVFTFGIHGVQGMLAHMGFPYPAFFAPVSMGVEFLGGIALILGLLTLWAAILLAINMAVAIMKVHLPHGFFLPGGYEFAFTLFAANVALALAGPGAAALDSVLFRKRRFGR